MRGRSEQMRENKESEFPLHCETECCSCGLTHELWIRVTDKEGREIKGARVFIRGRKNQTATRKARAKMNWKVRWNP